MRLQITCETKSGHKSIGMNSLSKAPDQSTKAGVRIWVKQKTCTMAPFPPSPQPQLRGQLSFSPSAAWVVPTPPSSPSDGVREAETLVPLLKGCS